MISRRSFLYAAGGAACSGAAWSDTEWSDTAGSQDQPTFSTDVKVVSLLATVHDKDGRVVKDLTKEDFALQDDGKPQSIRYFSRESDLPLTIGLLVDTSRSQTGVMEPERKSSYTFLSQVLREKMDQAFVVSFNYQVELLQDMTSSKQAIQVGLDRLRVPQTAGTMIYGAVAAASRLMRKQAGRKALIILSDGVSVRDSANLETSIEMAQQADAIIYTIRYSDAGKLDRPGRMMIRGIMDEKGRQALRRLSAETGGEEFEVSDQKPIEQVYAEIEELLRSQYSIGFTPGPSAEKGKFHKIKLTTQKRDLKVLTRAGYYRQ
jgi:VWFA-related protein